MVRKVLLFGGVLLTCLLLGHLALNATGIGSVVLEKATPTDAGKVSHAKKAATGLPLQEQIAREEKALGISSSNRKPENPARKTLEEAARATGLDPVLAAELSDAELQDLVKAAPATKTKVTAVDVKADPEALRNAADKLEAEMLKARYEAEEFERASASGDPAASAFSTSPSDRTPSEQPAAVKANAAAEEPVFVSPLLEQEYEAPVPVEEIRARAFESLQQRIDRGAEVTPAEKDDYDRYLAEYSEPSSRGRDGSLDNSGADTWGYAYFDNVAPDTTTFDWIELRGDPNATWYTMSGTDAGNAPWTQMGFSFPFYGVNHDSFKVYNDGNIQFPGGTLTSSYTNGTLPSTNMTSPAILPWWDDVHLTRITGATTSDRVAYRNFGTYTVVEWDSVSPYSSTCTAPNNRLKFEVIMFNDGRIKIQYDIVDVCNAADSSATVGIQATTTGPALQYCRGTGGQTQEGPLPVSGLAIWFAPVDWTHNYATSSITSPAVGATFAPNQTVPVTATFTNLATTEESSPVSYSFDGGATVTEATDILTRWGAQSLQFSTPITMPATPGTYTLTVWTDLANDELRGNDTLRTTVNVVVGADCGNEVVITTAGPDSATFNNCGMGLTNTPGVPCVTTVYNDMVFKKDVENGHTVSFWLTTNSWPTYTVRFAMRWGGACPGANTVNCVSATPYNQPLTWTNSTGSTQTVYFVLGGTSATYCGDIKVNWEDKVCAALDLPWTEGFETSPYAPVLPSCVMQENTDGIPPVWGSYLTNPRTGTKCASISGLATGIDDWLFTPGFNMEEGRDYFISYWRRVGAAASPDSVEVLAGLAPTAAAMTISAIPMDSSKRVVYQQRLGGFTCTASGVYYIGWHNVSKRSASRTYIDDISIDASNVCSTGTVTVNTTSGSDSVTLVASLGGNWFGGVPRYQWFTGTTCTEGNEIAGATSNSYKTYAPGVYACRVNIMTCVACDSAFADVIDCQTGGYGLSEGFESVTTPALPICWLQENLDTYTYTWVTSTTTPHSGTKVAGVYGYVSDGSAPNDWLYSKAVQLSSDTLYHVGYWSRLSSTTYTRSVEVFAGQGQNNAAMTIPVEAQYTPTTTTWEYHEATFTPPVTGSYNIGWHVSSPATQSGYIYIDDITVWAHGVCTPPSSVTVNATVGPDSAKLKAIAVGGTGGAYEYQWYTGTDCQAGNEIAGATTDSLWVFTSGVYSCKGYIINSVDCALCDSGYADVVDCGVALTLPVFEGFELTTGTLLPVCWQALDVNADGRPWRSNTTNPRSGLRVGYNQYSTGTPTDDWMITRGISLTAGDSVVVDYWYRCSLTSSTYSESLELRAGTAPNVEAMTIIVDSNYVFSAVATYQFRSGLLVVPTTGTYYFGWHAGYLTNQGGVLVDDIAIYHYGECSAPEISIAAASGQTYAVLSAVLTGGVGGQPQYQWYDGATCTPGNEIAGATSANFAAFASGTYACKAWFTDPVACGACASAVATVTPDACLPGTAAPFSDLWLSASLPMCWTQQNGNNDSYSWNYSSTYYNSTPYAAYLYTSTTPANDWLFWPPVQLTGGTPYRIEYWRRASSTSYTQTLKLAIGAHPHSSAMTTTLLAPYTFNTITWVRDGVEFTPTETGSYYLGLQNLTTVSSGSVYADDFRIFRPGLDCGPPATVVVNSVVGPDSAVLTCTATGGFGAADYSYQWYNGLDCTAGNEIVGATARTYGAPTTGVYSCRAYFPAQETCGLCDSAYATVLPCNANPVTTWPYFEGFEGLTTPNLPECWRWESLNGDAIKWSSSASYYRTGSRSCYLTYTAAATGAENDWLFSKPLHFAAGDTLIIDYWYRQAVSGAAGEVERLEVFVGTGARSDQMLYEVDPEFTFNSLTYANHLVAFPVTVTGDYYVGWHSVSAAAMNGTALDDIYLYPSTYCETPTANVPAVRNPATVTLTATPSGGFGSLPTYQWFTGETCAAGNEIAGATSNQYTTAVSGVFSCKINRGTCFACDSAYAEVLVPEPGELCTNPLPLTEPVYGTPTVVTGATNLFFPTCNVTCGANPSYSNDVFYTLTLSGVCRKITMVLTGPGGDTGDVFLTVYDGAANCCGTPLFCNDDDGQFVPLPAWDSTALHTAWPNSYLSAEMEPGTYYIRVGHWQANASSYTLAVHDLGPCVEPCDSVSDLTVYLNPTNPSQMWWHFDAPAPGTYKIFTTLVKNNDGDPNNGEDPQWSLDTTLTVLAAGVVECVDVDGGPVTNGYENYAVVHDCPQPGRCCYGDPYDPSCIDNERDECLALGGTWDRYSNCTDDPCFACISGNGETCETAICAQPFPFAVTNVSTAGFANDYELADDEGTDCLTSSVGYYGDGLDVIYKFTLLEATNLTFLYTRPGWGSLTIHNACPAPGTCIGGIKDPTSASEGSITLTVPCHSYPAGTYYVMIDSWSGYDPYTYNLSVLTCTP